ncbi:U3 snoRNP protein [Saitozyma podzolica]|uniref:U3 snoRNP protein n=1 Tax=Saitozyma podzolica TaxID=1890683 RepID=A0A427YRZ4_9TREE|nr:U3 snoRNP protein [Saitozyma podzolica]
MEKVQFQLESTLPELKDLHEKGLFSKNEIDQITRRRTALETSLVRRVTRKEDFFKYAEYEINLEKLRRVRWKRLGYDRNPPPPSASTFSLPRRVLYILKRATQKFPGDLAVWLAYVEYASREGMRKVVAKGLNSALQHHPLSPTLYLLSSYHHLHPSSPFPRSAIPSTSNLDLPSTSEENDTGFALEGTQPARTTLLLGLRMVPGSRDLWTEYVKLELGWVEALRRRWRVLGIKNELASSTSRSEVDFEGDPEALIGGEGAFGPEGEEARKAILAGQLVVHALTSALEAIPLNAPPEEEGDGIAFRESLLTMLRSYPSPLRTRCLKVVYDELEAGSKAGGRNAARARLLLLTKGLYDRPYDPERRDDGGVVLEGVYLVEELGGIGKEIRKASKEDTAGDWVDVAGGWLAKQIELCGDNKDLRDYLLSILTSLTKASRKPSPAMLLLHLDVLGHAAGGATVLKAARAHAAIHPSHPGLQRRLLVLELEHGENLPKPAFETIVKAVTRSGLSSTDHEDVIAIWLAWFNAESTGRHTASDLKVGNAMIRKILRESLRLGNVVPGLHSRLLLAYLQHSAESASDLFARLKEIQSTYRPSPLFYHRAFGLLSAAGSDRQAVQATYEAWRSVCTSPSERVVAVMTLAEHLLRSGRAKDANDAVEVTRREVRGDSAVLAGLEAEWKELLDTAEATGDSEEDGDDVDMDGSDAEE